MDINPTFNKKQLQAFKYLLNDSDTDICYGGGAGSGKCVIHNTLVSMSDGSLKEISNISVGDSVLALTENCEIVSSRVVAKQDTGNKDGFKFLLTGGSQCTVSKDHPFLIYNNGSPKWVKAENLSAGMAIAVPQRVPSSCNDRYDTDMYELFGYLIGNGGLTKNIIISMGTNQSVSRLKELIPEGYILKPLKNSIGDFGLRCYQHNDKGYPQNPLMEELKRLGLNHKSKHKRIPLEFFDISEKSIYALLSGIFATDGYVCGDRLGITLASEGLILDIQNLLLRVGIFCNTRYKKSKCGDKYFDAWEIIISGHHQLKKILENCNLASKQEKLSDIVAQNKTMIMGINYEYQKNDVRFRRIKSIEPVGSVSMYDIQTEHGSFIGNGVVLHNSYLGCAWLIISAIRYPGTRWLMGRAKLKNLEETTLVTFFDVASSWGLETEVHYKYNSKKNVIVFGKDYGGSIILLKDLFSYPSDPEFDSLGSLEITGGFIDEAAQITSKAKEIVRSRIRYKLDNFCPKCATQRTTEPLDDVEIEGVVKKQWKCSKCGTETFGLAPKILLTCNPHKGWLYNAFYKPWKDGSLPNGKRFIPALVGDNPFIQSTYIENLQGLTGTNRERLLEGNWEYDEESFSLITYDAILDVFSNRVPSGERIITADIARQGRDKTVVCLWDGLRAERFFTLDKNKIPEAADLIREVRDRYSVHWSNVYIDADGISAGVLDLLPDDVVGIVNNSPPLYYEGNKENFTNLKSQLYFMLSEYVNKRKMFIRTDENRDKIVQELEWVRRKDAFDDGKFAVIPKQEVKETLGRSPDFLDTLAYRMYHEINNGERFL